MQLTHQIRPSIHSTFTFSCLHGYYSKKTKTKTKTWICGKEYGGRNYVFPEKLATPEQRLMGYLGLLSGRGKFYTTELKSEDVAEVLR